MNSHCPFCDEPLEGKRTMARGGWRYCLKHRVGLREVQYAKRCNKCLGYIEVGELALMTRNDDGIWILLHPAGKCTAFTVNPEKNSSAFSVLFLKDDAPIEVVKAAYKALARMYHPDVGGDEEKMQKLNDAMDRICR